MNTEMNTGQLRPLTRTAEAAPQILPTPQSTYQLVLDAAERWPCAVAGQWIPHPADHARCLTWTYQDLAAQVTRIANALTALVADAAVEAVRDVLAREGLEPPREIRAGRENGRLVVTVAGLDPHRVSAAVAGFPLTVRSTH